MIGSKAVVIDAQSGPLLALTRTIVPFLYQTRTLSSSHWPKGRSINQSRYTNAIRRREFRCSASSSIYTGEDRATNHTGGPSHWRKSNSKDESQKVNGRLVIRGDDSELHPHKYSNPEIPLEFMPKRLRGDGLVLSRQSVGMDDIEEADDLDFNISRQSDFGLEDDNMFGDMNDIRDLAIPQPRNERASTITLSERHAFQRIFSDIFTRSQQPHGSHEGITVGYKEAAAQADKRQRVMSSLNSIMSGAIKESVPRSQEDVEAAVNRYPAALRPAAARAFGLTTNKDNIEAESTDLETIMDVDLLEQLRQPERDRVEAKMHAAKTDFNLWEIMENEVFSMVARLGLEDTPREQAPGGWKKGKKRSKKPVADVKNVNATFISSRIPGTFDTEHGLPPLALYGPLYPSYLLLGLRLLDRSFASPSPLALSILPKIKSLGLLSHVLGASTPLYNELLRIYWLQKSDFRGVLSLLSEMENAGLDLDSETLEIILDIMRIQNKVARGDKGPLTQLLWNFPEFAPGKFNVWRRKIQDAIAETDDGGGRLTY